MKTLLLAVLLSAPLAFAEENKGPPPGGMGNGTGGPPMGGPGGGMKPPLTKEERAKLAAALEKTAACLKTDKNQRECMRETFETCHKEIGPNCPIPAMRPPGGGGGGPGGPGGFPGGPGGPGSGGQGGGPNQGPGPGGQQY